MAVIPCAGRAPRSPLPQPIGDRRRPSPTSSRPSSSACAARLRSGRRARDFSCSYHKSANGIISINGGSRNLGGCCVDGHREREEEREGRGNSKEELVKRLRGAHPYIHAYRGSTFLVIVSGEIVSSPTHLDPILQVSPPLCPHSLILHPA